MPHALGRQVLVELHNCQQNTLNDVAAIETHMIAAATAAGATVINTTFHHFAPIGVSGVVVIQESHLTIHTWPERNFAAIDIFTCGQNVDPWRAVAYLKKAFASQRGDAREIPRGEISTPPSPQPSPQSPPDLIEHNLWFTERSDNLALSLRHTGAIYQTQSSHQKIEILNTAGYGRLLVLDGQIMCSEKDECIYHEMIAHIPALSHPHPEKALIIGGGDGGAVRELLRHPTINHIDLVEIDRAVVETAITYLPTLSCQLQNPKVHTHYQDGVDYLQSTSPNNYDLVLIDIPGVEALQSSTFYQHIYNALKPNGVMVAQVPPPVFFDAHFPKTIQAQEHIFQHIHPYFAFIPTYTTGMLSFAFASKDQIHPLKAFDITRIEAFTTQHPLKYYTSQIHEACFAVPPLVENLIQTGASS